MLCLISLLAALEQSPCCPSLSFLLLNLMCMPCRLLCIRRFRCKLFVGSAGIADPACSAMSSAVLCRVPCSSWCFHHLLQPRKSRSEADWQPSPACSPHLKLPLALARQHPGMPTSTKQHELKQSLSHACATACLSPNCCLHAIA